MSIQQKYFVPTIFQFKKKKLIRNLNNKVSQKKSQILQQKKLKYRSPITIF